jgi:chondroitin AC lyase
VYDWQKIPGATIMQRTEMPDPKEIQKKGLTDFVGAVTDGMYGAVGFDFKSPLDPLKARKSWFFFNDEYVCLGAGISGDSNLSVVTTLNQCLLKGNIAIMSDDKKSIAEKGERQLKNVQWILHDSIGYLFPKSANVTLSNRAQTGSWYKVNHQSDSPKDEISMDVFKLWIDHGTHPKDATYEYIVVPATTEQKLTKESQNSGVVVLANTPNLQAVRNTKLNISEAVFYTEGTIAISNKLKLTMNNPGIVMVKTNGSSIKSMSVEDPTHKLTSISLSVSAKLVKQGKNFKAYWDENKKASIISIDLPKTNYAGESVTINF